MMAWAFVLLAVAKTVGLIGVSVLSHQRKVALPENYSSRLLRRVHYGDNA